MHFDVSFRFAQRATILTTSHVHRTRLAHDFDQVIDKNEPFNLSHIAARRYVQVLALALLLEHMVLEALSQQDEHRLVATQKKWLALVVARHLSQMVEQPLAATLVKDALGKSSGTLFAAAAAATLFIDESLHQMQEKSVPELFEVECVAQNFAQKLEDEMY